MEFITAQEATKIYDSVVANRKEREKLERERMRIERQRIYAIKYTELESQYAGVMRAISDCIREAVLAEKSQVDISEKLPPSIVEFITSPEWNDYISEYLWTKGFYCNWDVINGVKHFIIKTTYKY